MFLAEVEHKLLQSGLKTWSAYPIAGMTMDLVVAGKQGTCGIDLIGYPGEFQAVFSLERYKMFHRAGLRVFPLPFSRWRVDPETCVAEIKRIVG